MTLKSITFCNNFIYFYNMTIDKQNFKLQNENNPFQILCKKTILILTIAAKKIVNHYNINQYGSVPACIAGICYGRIYYVGIPVARGCENIVFLRRVKSGLLQNIVASGTLNIFRNLLSLSHFSAITKKNLLGRSLPNFTGSLAG